MIKDLSNPLHLALFILRAQATDLRVDSEGWLHQAGWSRAAESLGLAERGYVKLLHGSDGPIAVKPSKKLYGLRDRIADRNGLPAWAA